jgi:protease IV
MRKHPLLAGLAVFGILFSLFFVSLWVLSILSSREESLWGGDKIAVVEIRGVILDPQSTVEKLIKLRKNDRVKAVVLRIDSPGGGVSPSQEIHSEVKRLQQEKKVLVSMGAVAASGGYYIACGADKILANPGTMTGSIGVIAESLNVEDLLRKIGLRSMVIKSGRHKDIGSPFREMSPEEKSLLQSVLDNIHEQFILAVAEGRKMPVEKVRELATGRVFTGEQAKSLGLVDGLGTLQDTITAAATMAGIQGEPEVIYPEKKRFSIIDLLLESTVQKIWEIAADTSPRPYFLYSLPGKIQ